MWSCSDSDCFKYWYRLYGIVKRGKEFPLAVCFVVAVAIIQIVLIIAGVASPVSKPTNVLDWILFLARWLPVVVIGWSLSSKGVWRAAGFGAILVAASTVVLILGGIVADKPVIGISTPGGFGLLLTMLVVIISNALLGGIVAIVAAFSRKILARK